MDSSLSSLSSEPYDMVDDISDLSSDDHDHDTVSLASTEQAEEADQDSPYSQIADILDDMRSLSQAPAADIDETPRQSTITVKVEQPLPSTPPKAQVNKHGCDPLCPDCEISEKLPQIMFWLIVSFIGLVGLCYLMSPVPAEQVVATHSAQLAARQQRLGEIMSELHYSKVNYTHLLPERSWLDDRYRSQFLRQQDVRYQQLHNDLVVSIPERLSLAAHSAPAARRDDEQLPVKMKQLMERVYLITVDDPFGLVRITIPCSSSEDIEFTHDFGQPLIHAVRSLAIRVNTDLQVFLVGATSSAQRINTDLQLFVDKAAIGVKDLATVVQTEVRRDLAVSRSRALSIAGNLKSFADRTRSKHAKRSDKKTSKAGGCGGKRRRKLSRARA